MQFASLLTVLSVALAAFASPAQRTRVDLSSGDLQSAREHAAELDPLTVGTPLSSSNGALQPLSLGGVFLCTDVNWNGHCGHATQPLNECIVLGSEWKNKVSSFGPDECTSCIGFATSDCSIVKPPNSTPVQAWLFNYPGDATGGIGTNNPWNDRIASFECSQAC